MPSPNSRTGANGLNGVGVVSADDVWVVGYYDGNSTGRTLTEHWDGTVWTIVPSPNSGSGTNILYGIAAVSANDVWAVGYYHNGTTSQTLTEHWMAPSGA